MNVFRDLTGAPAWTKDIKADSLSDIPCKFDIREIYEAIEYGYFVALSSKYGMDLEDDYN